MEIVKSSLTSPSILKHFGRSTREVYLKNLENIITNPEAAKLVGTIVNNCFIIKYYLNLFVFSLKEVKFNFCKKKKIFNQILIS